MSNTGDKRVRLTPILNMSHYQKQVMSLFFQTAILNFPQRDPGSLGMRVKWSKNTTCVTWPRQHLALTAVATAPQSTQAAALLGLGHGGSVFCSPLSPLILRENICWLYEHIVQLPSHLFSCTHESMRENGELNGVQFCSNVFQTLPPNLCTTVMALCCDPRSKVEGQRPTWILMSPYRVILALQPGSTSMVLWVESTMQITIRVTWLIMWSMPHPPVFVNDDGGSLHRVSMSHFFQ